MISWFCCTNAKFMAANITTQHDTSSKNLMYKLLFLKKLRWAKFPKNSRLLNSRSHSRSLAPSLPPSFIAFLPTLFHFFLSARLCLPLSFLPRSLPQLCLDAAALQPHSWTRACTPHSRDWRGSTLGNIGNEVLMEVNFLSV